MTVKVANSAFKRSGQSVFRRLGTGQNVNTRVCVFWLEGKCNRNPCRFLHTESLPLQPRQSLPRTSEDKHSTRSLNTWTNPQKCIRTTSNKEDVPEVKVSQETRNTAKIIKGAGSEPKGTPKPKMTQCKYWVNDNCVHGDKCKDLHAWSFGNGFSMLAKLEGNSRAITGIYLPSGSSQLYSGSKDKSVRVWDCSTGQCAGVIKFDQEIGCLVGEGPCMLVGFPNVIKVWNFQKKTELDLSGPNSQVNAIDVCDNMLFAGTEDGTILVWKSSTENMHPELVASQKGHSRAVLSLVVGTKRLYSASRDNTIKVWDLETVQCLQTLHGHTDAVMSVLCWDSYLISGSLDKTIKVWAATESGSIEVIYEHNTESGVLAFRGVHDAEAKPILICSCNDNTVRLYDLPSFCERGRIFTKGVAQSVQVADNGLIFTGDENGQLSVWQLHGKRDPTAP